MDFITKNQIAQVQTLLKSAKCKKIMSDLSERTKNHTVKEVLGDKKELNKIKKFAKTEAERIIRSGEVNPFKGKRMKKGDISRLKKTLRDEKQMSALVEESKKCVDVPDVDEDQDIDSMIDSIKNDKVPKVIQETDRSFKAILCTSFGTFKCVHIYFEDLKTQVTKHLNTRNFVSKYKILPDGSFMYYFYEQESTKVNSKCSKMFHQNITGSVLIFIKNVDITVDYLKGQFPVLVRQMKYFY